MKFSAFASLALLAGAASAMHIPNFKAPRALHKRVGPSASPTPTSSSASAGPTPPPTNSTSGYPFPSGKKRGVSYNDASLLDQFPPGSLSFAYDWAQTPGGTLPSGVEFIPQLWGGATALIDSWSANAASAIASGSGIIFSVNEPDLDTQSNMTPEQAASVYQQTMMPFVGQALLISPAVTNGPPPNMGTGWLQSFFAACTNCHFDGLAIHIYSGTDPTYYQNYITSVIEEFNLPVWVTEFGAAGDDADIASFMNTMVPWLEAEPGVAAYAYFMAADGILVNADGSLTDIGNAYVSA